MTRYSQAAFRQNYRVGHVIKGGDKPMEPPTERKRKTVIDTDALAAALAELDAQAAVKSVPTTGNQLPATGHCHNCDRAVSGERRYCGPCLARRI